MKKMQIRKVYLAGIFAGCAGTDHVRGDLIVVVICRVAGWATNHIYFHLTKHGRGGAGVLTGSTRREVARTLLDRLAPSDRYALWQNRTRTFTHRN